ncbi:hypothetical protein ACFOKI_07400 [Sphingomonas qilianensis]|uniref:Uncharacterized protein n=1 Tax=Sphingomonas qilianensis TaxID=1736690 RepID=A0ABU9XQY8_9SPHN
MANNNTDIIAPELPTACDVMQLSDGIIVHRMGGGILAVDQPDDVGRLQRVILTEEDLRDMLAWLG